MTEITSDYTKTVQYRLNIDPEFAAHLFDEAIALFLNNEPDTARLMLRELVNATVGFEDLAEKIQKPSKSLHRMLSLNGNPTMDNFTKIIAELRKILNVNFDIHTVPA